MSVIFPSYKVKRRYIFLLDNFLDENKLKESYVKYFGEIDYYKANILFLNINNNIVLSVNRKRLSRLLFILYILNINKFLIFKTIKGIKRYINIS